MSAKGWTAVPGDSVVFVYDADGEKICTVGNAPYWEKFKPEHLARATLISQAPALYEALAELIASIDKRWEGETERKREAAVSPRTEEAIAAAKFLLAAARGAAK